MTTNSLSVKKLQHPIKIRLLQVTRIANLSPSMRRITLSGDDLSGFLSASFDDHIKLFIPDAPGAKPDMPTLGATGIIFAENKPKPITRDYTPRRYNALTNELDIDFVLHHAGPATDWANQAELGHYLGIAGPRGSFIIPHDFDWHLLIGDETALPAIARRLEELPATTKAIAIIKTAIDSVNIDLNSQCELEVRWVKQKDNNPSEVEALTSSLADLALPEGEGYVWAAGEYSDIKGLRQYIIDNLNIDKSRIRASSYWRKSAIATHTHFE